MHRSSLAQVASGGAIGLRLVMFLGWTLVASGCASSVDPIGQRNYDLIAVGDQHLPADLGPVPIFGRDSSGGITTTFCHALVKAGRFQLDPRSGSFSFGYSTVSACNGTTLSVVTLSGSYTANNDSLFFLVPAAVPPDYRFTGKQQGQLLLVIFPDMQMTFEQSRS